MTGTIEAKGTTRYMNFLTTRQAADKKGVTVRRIVALIKEGKLKATQFGDQWMILEADLDQVTFYQRAGRPPKAK